MSQRISQTMRREMVAKLQQYIHLVICPSGGTKTYEDMDKTFTTQEKLYKAIATKLLSNKLMAKPILYILWN